MPRNFKKLISFFISFCLILEQSAFAQSIDLSHYFANSGKPILQNDKFRPLHLRYLGYDNLNNDFKILLDKGDTKKEDLDNKNYIEENTQTLLKYFFIGLALPNEKFWVNLRPDSPDNILDPDLEKTDIGRIFLEADLQLKKDTASFTSPQTKEGKEYWDKLYQKSGELFGTENITIPTITRPWIVPGEIIIREAPDNAYIYKATLKVMLEEDYLNTGNQKPETSNQMYSFSDPRLKELNEYSTQLIKETIIPKLTYEVNTSKRYAPLRQVYYSLILAQWFKTRYRSQRTENRLQITEKANNYLSLIDSGNLTNLTSSQLYDKQTYFKQYQKSFADGEYNLQESVYTPMGQSIRRYMSGGAMFSGVYLAIERIPGKRVDINIRRPYEIASVSSSLEPFKVKIASSLVEKDMILKIFGEVKVALNEPEIILQPKVLLSYIQDLRAGKMNKEDIYSDIYKGVKLQKDILLQTVDPIEEQKESIAQTEPLLKDYFELFGVTYQPVKVVFVPREIVPPIVGAVHFTYYNTLVFPDNLKKQDLVDSFIHESLHSNSFGFAPQKLDEGMTEYLLVKLLMKQEGKTDFSYSSMLNFYREYLSRKAQKYISSYIFELAAILHLIGKIKEKEESMVTAYFKGDQGLLETVLGENVWQRIVNLAYQYENLHGKAPESYLSQIREILDSRDGDARGRNQDKGSALMRAIFQELGGNNTGHSLIFESDGKIRILKENTQIMVFIPSLSPQGSHLEFIYVNDKEKKYLGIIKKIIPTIETIRDTPSPFTYEVTISPSNKDQKTEEFETSPSRTNHFKMPIVSSPPQGGINGGLGIKFPESSSSLLAEEGISDNLSARLAVEGDLQNRLNAQEILNKLNFLGALELEYGLASGRISGRVGQFYTSLSNILTENGFDVTVAGRLAQTFARMKNGSLEILGIAGVITEEEKGIFVSKNENELRALDNQVKREFADRLKRLCDSYKRNLNKRYQEAMLKRLIPLEIIEPLCSEYNTSITNIMTIISERPNFLIWLPKAKAKVEQIKDRVGGAANAWVIVMGHGLDKVDSWLSLAESKVKSIKDRVGGSATNAWAIVIRQGIGGVDVWLKFATELASPSIVNKNSDIGGVDGSTSSPITNNDKGGIAFNALPIQTESVASSALGFFPGFRAFQGDIDAEWAQIQSIFNAGIRPSVQRLSEYTLAVASRGGSRTAPTTEEKIDLVRAMLADILRREEEAQNLTPADPALKVLLIALESDKV
ncbi:MAG: hypothetical protein Q7J72_02570 [Candidatus Omnitrophota bacterium]|nr:hypothetical protein [Candidatus Omnitrophota bacterium]